MKKIIHMLFMTSNIILLVWNVDAYAAPAPIITSTQARDDRADNSYGIGFTTSIAERPFIGVDDQNTSLVYLSYKYKQFYIEGLDVGFNLYNDKTFYIDLLGTPRFYEVEPSFADNGELDGIDKTRPSYFAGLSFQLTTDLATYTVQLLHDLIESDGNEAVVQVSKSIRISNDFSLIPSVGLTYQDARLVDYYYGVQPHEVTAGRAQYSGKGSLNYNATLNANWNVTKHIELLGQIKFDKLGDGIFDSTIVDNDTLLSYTIGAVYRF